MNNPEDDGWRTASMDWASKRERCRASLATEGPGEKQLRAVALFVVVTLVISAVTTLCVLENWRSRGGEKRNGNGVKEEVLRSMVGKEIDLQLNRLEPDIHFTLQASSQIDENGILIGWRNAHYSLNADREYVVPSTDYYMIYTCLSFLAPPADVNITYWQELWRNSTGGEDKLMKDAQIQRCGNSQSGTEVVFCRRSSIIVILKLRKGERIYVKASHPHLTSRTNGTSYFGVVRMS